MNFEKLAKWSEENYSHLPWRVNRTVYSTLVSEIMLQQTTVSTVINHFDKFMDKYPTVKDLASITEEQIQIDWKGLGYYRRARNLLKAAKEIQQSFDGELPQTIEELKSISGIGDYTANAIVSIGRDQRSIAVDANLERVLSRYYGIKAEKGPKLQKELQRLFISGEICQEISIVGSRVFNESLMDLGRSICKARTSSCEICPLAQTCVALSEKAMLDYPIIKDTNKVKQSFDLSLLRIICHKEDEILAYKKNESQWLAGQYEIPTFMLSSDDKKFGQYPALMSKMNYEFLPSFKSAITKYKITNYVVHLSLDELRELGVDPVSYEYVKNTLKENFSTATFKSLAL